MNTFQLEKLSRILSLLGSDHAGERAAAALAAHKLVVEAKTNWTVLLGLDHKSKPAPKRMRETGMDYAAAAESRLRQLCSENQRLERQSAMLRRRVAAMADRERKLKMAEDGE